MSSKFRAYLWLAGFFALGAVGGAAAGRAFTQRQLASALFRGDHQTREALFLNSMAKELDLSDAQRADVARLNQRYRTRRHDMMQQVFQTCGKPLDELQVEMDGEMSTILDADQAARWRALMAQRKQQHGR